MRRPFAPIVAALLLSPMLVASTSVPAAAEPGWFSDVPAEHVFAGHIAWLDSTGITTGYTEHDGSRTFRPAQPVLREQMAAFLTRYAGEDDYLDEDGTEFADLQTGHVFFDEIEWLASTGITTGYVSETGVKTFRGSQPVLREQMAAFLFRFAQIQNHTPAAQRFTDVPPSHTFYREIDWLASTGITRGYDNGNGTFRFAPGAPVLREQMAAFLYRGEHPTVGTSTSVRSGHGFYHDVSTDGRYLSFLTRSSFVPQDTNGYEDIYVYDGQTGTNILASGDATGAVSEYGAGGSSRPAISGDGRWVVYQSQRQDLIGEVYPSLAIVKFDRESGAVTVPVRTSDGRPASGLESPDVSADGRYIVMVGRSNDLVPGDTNGTPDIFLWDDVAKTLTMISRTGSAIGNGESSEPKISADGSTVAFTSSASNLVPGDTNGSSDAFVWHRATGAIELVSRDGTGAIANGRSMVRSISADGRSVAFMSLAPSLGADGELEAFVHDAEVGGVYPVGLRPDGYYANAPATFSGAPFSADGSTVGFTSRASDLAARDTNGEQDAFLLDVLTFESILISHGPQGSATGGNSLWVSDDANQALWITLDNVVMLWSRLPGLRSGRS